MPLAAGLGSSLFVVSGVCLGAGYGIFDSRALGMGGATVAAASTDHAVFYNPALMAFHDEYEDESEEGRFYLPLLALQTTESVIDVEGFVEDNLDGRLSATINNFNANGDEDSARSVLAATTDVLEALDDIDNRDLSADIHLGLAITEPSKREGGGFFFGVRVLGGGLAEVADTDVALLQDYADTLTFSTSDGAEGEFHPELFDGAGNLVDPNDSLASSFDARGVTIVEAGVAFSREYTFYGQKVALGVSPKIWQVEVYETSQRLVEGRRIRRNRKTYRSGNLDVGLALELGDQWRVGLAVKDIVSHNYQTQAGGVAKLRPRPRLGVAYQLQRLQLGLDLDLAASEPVGSEAALQEAALGAEWVVSSWMRLRGGYRHDLEGARDDIASLGLGFGWRSFLFDFSYAKGSDSRALGIQFGYTF